MQFILQILMLHQASLPTSLEFYQTSCYRNSLRTSFDCLRTFLDFYRTSLQSYRSSLRISLDFQCVLKLLFIHHKYYSILFEFLDQTLHLRKILHDLGASRWYCIKLTNVCAAFLIYPFFPSSLETQLLKITFLSECAYSILLKVILVKKNSRK